MFVADLQYNRIVGIVIRLGLARDSDGRAKFVRGGSWCARDRQMMVDVRADLRRELQLRCGSIGILTSWKT